MLQKDIIVNADSISEIKKLPDNCIDLIFVDPPYWMRVTGTLSRTDGTDFDGCNDEWDQFDTLDDYATFTRSWLEECYRILKDDGSFWVIGLMQCIYTIGAISRMLGFGLLMTLFGIKRTRPRISWELV